MFYLVYLLLDIDCNLQVNSYIDNLADKRVAF